ncbi:MAG: penicillin acylase family protein [Pseudomonadota bacterium]
MKQTVRLLAATISMSVAASTLADDSTSYSVDIRTTSYGIPHILADDWGSMGFGYGYAFAGDNLCVLAREVVAANGELSRFFGGSSGNITNDLFYTLVSNDEFIAGALDDIDPNARDGIRGFVAGYNRYLSDTGVDNLAAECRGAAWVRSIDETDLARVYYKLILRASGGPLSSLIVDARPPADGRSPTLKRADDLPQVSLAAVREMINTEDLGSNMYALGSQSTVSGKGMLLGNPHFPWRGPLRWYQAHLTIPGELNVMGASLQGVPLINIGFTDEYAWSHTVSPADRFGLFEIQLAPGDPTSYIYDGETLAMGQHPVSIQVLVDGELETRTHTFYSTVHGWVLDFEPLFGFRFWDTRLAVFALGDANAGSLRAINQFYDLNVAADFDGFIDALRTNVGLPWVHTVAASPDGRAFYGDISVQPNITAQKLVDCPPIIFGQSIVDQAGLFVLDGRSTACRFDNDEDAPTEGIIGFEALPKLENTTYVSNSNDNHWLTNPEQPLEGFQPPGRPERTARTVRTRSGLVFARERLAGTDGLGAPGFTIDTLQEILFGSRNYAAELLVDELVTVCLDEGASVDIDGTTVDLMQACNLLGSWDKRQNPESIGVPVFAEFLQSVFNELDDPIVTDLWANPFDVNDPVNTPNGLKAATPEDRARVMRWLGEGIQRLNANNIDISAPWGDLQYDTRNGVRLAIHGGSNVMGMFSIISASLGPGGYTPIDSGNSYMQTVTFDEDGAVAEALLSYSQSSDPEDENFADQTELYQNKQWVSLPFREADILADPNLVTLELSGIKDGDNDAIGDDIDNCLGRPNTDQRDTDGDGFGNICDADFNNDGFTNFIDLGLFRAGFGGDDPTLDLSGDGAVNAVDLGLLRSLFYAPPGPAGISIGD